MNLILINNNFRLIQKVVYISLVAGVCLNKKLLNKPYFLGND